MRSPLYDQDFVAWTEEQAALLRGNDLSGIDREHLAEEIESVGASERREMRHRLARLLQHLLKWTYQPDHRSRSWSATIHVQRDELVALLDDSPSLRATLPDVLPRAYELGRRWALDETGLLALPDSCPWTAEQVISTRFLPD
jgi:uncharacterized protein DUF29